MTIRLYLEEDAMDKDLVQAIRARGVDVITALDAGMIERADEEHLDYATAQGRVLHSLVVPLDEQHLPETLKIDLASTGPKGARLQVLVNSHELL